jgi:hypothetical protein
MGKTTNIAGFQLNPPASTGGLNPSSDRSFFSFTKAKQIV